MNKLPKVPGLPEVKFNKNGYEIRADMLKLAQDYVMFDYSAKIGQIQMSSNADPETGQILQKVTFPEVPGGQQVLEMAQKFYDFVNQKNI